MMSCVIFFSIVRFETVIFYNTCINILYVWASPNLSLKKHKECLYDYYSETWEGLYHRTFIVNVQNDDNNKHLFMYMYYTQDLKVKTLSSDRSNDVVVSYYEQFPIKLSNEVTVT